MALRATTNLPHPVHRVTEVFTDEDFIRSSSESVGGKLVSFERNGALDSAFSTKTVRTLPTNRLPDLAKKFVGASITVTQLEDWSVPEADGSRTVDLTLTVSGAPLTVTAVERLVTEGAGSRVDLEGTVTSTMPFLGAKIAEAAEPMIGKALNLQSTHARSWLENHPA
ncbi:DUF2505 domain-containing protein [Paenarthrobacter sp. PH39-S1]|uniref:DUF2505 domain-containing protein n=1 Tax=Paenarthrobacter sp. PH39-S1 TaxID=3046204 RepID=UPI0024BBBD07|nr:DUF2505 domain-containing protein [Paenarthrobacter sp. PH39-S1]MDJ0356096.1 DUF2505 domain-containing protein [Paenarthrobacter sp. PH39-S1]